MSSILDNVQFSLFDGIFVGGNLAHGVTSSMLSLDSFLVTFDRELQRLQILHGIDTGCLQAVSNSNPILNVAATVLITVDNPLVIPMHPVNFNF